MIHITDIKINDIPCLLIEKQAHVEKKLPLVVYLHGFGRAKEDGLTLAYLLARQNMRVVLPDSIYHGAREEEISPEQKKLYFWDIVAQNIKDIGSIKKHFSDKNLILNHKIGVAGMSMGGISTAAALTQYEWITSSGLLMATANMTDYAMWLLEQEGGRESLGISEMELTYLMTQLESTDLSRNIELLNDRPLFMWHGTKDEMIPFKYAEDFYQKLQKYHENVDDIELLIEENRGHYLSYRAVLALCDWFVKTLSKQ